MHKSVFVSVNKFKSNERLIKVSLTERFLSVIPIRKVSY